MPATPPADTERARLEAAFWACDYATTRGLLDPGTADACCLATERLKNEVFGGDFQAMLAWWQRNKAQAHRRIEEAERGQSGP